MTICNHCGDEDLRTKNGLCHGCAVAALTGEQRKVERLRQIAQQLLSYTRDEGYRGQYCIKCRLKDGHQHWCPVGQIVKELKSYE